MLIYQADMSENNKTCRAAIFFRGAAGGQVLPAGGVYENRTENNIKNPDTASKTKAASDSQVFTGGSGKCSPDSICFGNRFPQKSMICC